MTRTQHTPKQAFVPTPKPTQGDQQQTTGKIGNFSGHTPAQTFTPNKVGDNIQLVRGVDKTDIGDLKFIKGTHHTPEKSFTPTTEPKPASPPPEPPKE
jgi:hypothetical protein